MTNRLVAEPRRRGSKRGPAVSARERQRCSQTEAAAAFRRTAAVGAPRARLGHEGDARQTAQIAAPTATKIKSIVRKTRTDR